MAKSSLKILAFGVAQDLMGGNVVNLSIDKDSLTVGELRTVLTGKYPKLTELASLLIAVNTEYAEDDTVVRSGDEIAVIPPTSGG